MGLPEFPRRGGQRYPGFTSRMNAEATGLVEEGGTVAGVRAKTPEGPLEISADLVVAADGRGSMLRERAGLEIEDLGAPMDVLWFRLPHRPATPPRPWAASAPAILAHALSRRLLAVRLRHRQGLAREAARPAGSTPSATRSGGFAVRRRARMNAITSLGRRQAAHRARRPADELVHGRACCCIGDAAHAMSPDRRRRHQPRHRRTRSRRPTSWPARCARTVDDRGSAAVQSAARLPDARHAGLQVPMQNNIIGPTLRCDEQSKPPLRAAPHAALPVAAAVSRRACSASACAASMCRRLHSRRRRRLGR